MIERIYNLCYAAATGRSPKWPKVRADWLRDHPVCAACGGDISLNVHHLKPFAHYPDLELSPENLLTLCEYHGCHLRIGHSFRWDCWNEHAVEDAALSRQRIRDRRHAA